MNTWNSNETFKKKIKFNLTENNDINIYKNSNKTLKPLILEAKWQWAFFLTIMECFLKPIKQFTEILLVI